MDIRKIMPIFVILLLLLTVSYAAGGDYKIPEAVKHVEVMDDGSCKITEEIIYDIGGVVNGTYRDIPLTGNQSVTNISVDTPGYYNTVEIQENSNNTRIKVWLYEDKEKTRKVNNQEVKVIYKYTFNKGVKVYNDIAEFQYTSWGDEWDSKISSLKTYIKIPGSSSECEYWNNPDTYVTSSGWNDDNELETVAKDIPKRTNFEQRIIMPKEYIKSTENAQVIAVDAKAQIKQDQQKYAQKQSNNKITPMIFLSVIALIMLLPAAIYLLFGREPKIDYDAEYEYDLPSDSTPVEVNAILVDNVGEVNFDAFGAVILDLMDRGYIRIVSANRDNTIITIAREELAGLRDYELDLINYLGSFMDSNGNISMADIRKNQTRSQYQGFMSRWQQKASDSVPALLKKRYFNTTGLKVFKVFSVLMIIVGIGLFLLGIITSIIIALIGVVMIIEAIILLKKHNTLFGRWTREGKEYHDRWMNFKRYICDYSLLNERPPESIRIWGKYLVYAAALGCADEATSVMQKYFNTEEMSGDYVTKSNVVFFTYHGGFNQMQSTFKAFQAPNSGGSSGDIGRVGSGGFGGGGGGVF